MADFLRLFRASFHKLFPPVHDDTFDELLRKP
jgi:hypothetical protein